MDTQEMLAEYGATKLVDEVILDHAIEDMERRKNPYEFDLMQINDFGFEKAMKMTLLSDVKKDLEKANLPVTEQTVVAHITAYIERASEGIEIAKEERR
jgi:hypothetical protein